jgi:hypothetical protein
MQINLTGLLGVCVMGLLVSIFGLVYYFKTRRNGGHK